MEKLIKQIVESDFIESLPFNSAIIDRYFNVIKANKRFGDFFGNWEGKKCHEVCKKMYSGCSHCQAEIVFETGDARSINEKGLNAYGRTCDYYVHMVPLKDDSGKVKYVLELSSDITGQANWQKEYNLLFEKSPNYITVIDRDFRIIRANEKFRETFGDVRGKHCYEVYKKKKSQCDSCPARDTFNSGVESLATEIGKTSSGEKAYYVVNTLPMTDSGGKPNLVMEIANDITELTKIQEQLSQLNEFYNSIIDHIDDGVIIVDSRDKVQLINSAAKKLFDWNNPRRPGSAKLKKLLPDEYFMMEKHFGEELFCSKMHKLKDDSGLEKIVEFKSYAIGEKGNLGRLAIIKNRDEILSEKYSMMDSEIGVAKGRIYERIVDSLDRISEEFAESAIIGEQSDRKIAIENLQHRKSQIIEYAKKANSGYGNFAHIHPNYVIKEIAEEFTGKSEYKTRRISVDPDPNVRPGLMDRLGLESAITTFLEFICDLNVSQKKGAKKIALSSKSDGKILAFKIEGNFAEYDCERCRISDVKAEKYELTLELLLAELMIIRHGGSVFVNMEKDKKTVFEMLFPLRNLELIANRILSAGNGSENVHTQ